ncbi:flagellar assembly protein FliW [sulfur-oxidizing endosymbiont of Gigantopelta aegis]|uniref:flagellar assembly protein FliW n=1 Tax=sulfur-oxidizing endosymbiont of Gigantopelta aegis TaxID=2794934 RepID=UPI0018DD04DD|nr:flagellar assembly protein FliW [sulfur-oxidizing endosymbiont of Gigantopelta aegis]
MKIETTRFGSQEVTQESIIHFPNGLLSNAELKNFKLFHKEDDAQDKEGAPVVFWLQSIEQPDTAFSIFDPSLANFYYEVSLPDEDYKLLDSEGSSEIAMMVIVKDSNADSGVKKEGLTLVNANITEPLFLNLHSQKGLQRSIKDLDYDIFLNVPVVDSKS